MKADAYIKNIQYFISSKTGGWSLLHLNILCTVALDKWNHSALKNRFTFTYHGILYVIPYQ